jgi:long-chain acyl-CoA synthetase
MIISGGENIYSAEVELAILEHPDVMECAVIGIPHPRWGEAVHAIIVLRAHATITQEQVLTHCRARIAGYKCPKTIEFLKEVLPRSPTGKIRKTELRAARRISETVVP